MINTTSKFQTVLSQDLVPITNVCCSFWGEKSFLRMFYVSGDIRHHLVVAETSLASRGHLLAQTSQAVGS